MRCLARYFALSAPGTLHPLRVSRRVCVGPSCRQRDLAQSKRYRTYRATVTRRNRLDRVPCGHFPSKLGVFRRSPLPAYIGRQRRATSRPRRCGLECIQREQQRPQNIRRMQYGPRRQWLQRAGIAPGNESRENAVGSRVWHFGCSERAVNESAAAFQRAGLHAR